MTDAREAARTLLAQLADSRVPAEDAIVAAFRLREEEAADELAARLKKTTVMIEGVVREELERRRSEEGVQCEQETSV